MKKQFNPDVFLGLSVVGFLCSGTSAILFAHIPWVWKAMLGIAVVALIAYLVIGRESHQKFLAKKSTRYGINSVLMSLVVFAIAVVINMIASNHDIKRDVTKNKLHTLSEQSIKVLKGLTSEVKFRAFVPPMQTQEFDTVFDKYKYYSDKVSREYVDADKDPLAVKRYNIKQLGTILVESETRTARIENLNSADDPKIEEKITNAIIQVAKGDKKKVYFIAGHGERLFGDTGPEGYSEIKTGLEDGRYNVAELRLIEHPEIPKDADLLILSAPRSQLMESETKALYNYLRRGGDLLVMLEPTSSESMKQFLSKFGVDWNPNKIVVETQLKAQGNPVVPVVIRYDSSHEITKEARQPTIFNLATPVEKSKDTIIGMTVTSLFSTSDRSFEVTPKGDKVILDEKKDRRGPLSLAVAVTGKLAADGATEGKDDKKAEKKEDKKEHEFRLVVVGDADFPANGMRHFGINSDVFQNMLSWLANESDLISIRPKPSDLSEFDITPQRASLIMLVSMVFAPLSMFAAGIAVWVMRKKK